MALEDIQWRDKKGNWNKASGVTSDEEFLNNPLARGIALKEFLRRNRELLSANNFTPPVNQTLHGIEGDLIVTENGLAAAMHRAGAPVVKRYLKALANQNWVSNESQWPEEQRPMIRAIEDRLRDFADIPYLRQFGHQPMAIRPHRWWLPIAFAVTLLVSCHPAVLASDEIPIKFQTGTPPDGAWLVVERWMRGQDDTSLDNFDYLQDHIDRTIKFGWAKDSREALASFLDRDMFWAYADLDGDGIDEMLILIAIGPYCGTIGCSTLELHRNETGWRIENGLTMATENDLCYRRNGPNGRPSFRNHSDVFWWSGGLLDGVCYAYCSHWWDRDAIDPKELAEMTPEELSMRDNVRKQPWCAVAAPD